VKTDGAEGRHTLLLEPLKAGTEWVYAFSWRKREIEGCDIWEEEIRAALAGSRELVLLATRDGLKSD
jgi:hypothetical protein